MPISMRAMPSKARSTGFLRRSRESAERALAAGRIPEANRDEVRRFLAVMDNPDSLRPTRPVTGSGDMTIAGRRLRVNLAAYAATEGDIWIHDAAAGLVVAGDLVVAPLPFMDTACPEGWRRALDEIAATPFATLIPGHGEPMDRAAFLAWRARVQRPARLRRLASGRRRTASPAGGATRPASSRPAARRRWTSSPLIISTAGFAPPRTSGSFIAAPPG